jgi:predicted dinucleotide-binding enzyme
MRQLSTQGKEKAAKQGGVIFAAVPTDKISAFPET